MINIIPKPNLAKWTQGEFPLSSVTKVTGIFAEEFQLLTQELKQYSQSGISNAIETAKASDLGKEAYSIEILPEKIKVLAGGAEGAFYACQTLRQACKVFIGEKQDFFPVCCGKIEDAPRYVHRGFMMDVARHFFGIEKVKQTLSMMALYKLNVFHFHLTDDQGWRIEIKKYPLLAQKGSVRKSTQLNADKSKRDNSTYGENCYFTQEQIKEIVEYAKKLHITVIPEIEMPGHLVAAIACYPFLSCEAKEIDVSQDWGILDSVGCCGKEEFVDFVKDVVDEVCQLFPAPYFHIGGDEVPKNKWKDCPHCQQKIKEENLADEDDLQGYFTAVMGEYLAKKGKRLIGWNEILNSPRVLPDTIIQWWTPTGGKKAKAWVDGGGKAILCKWNNFYLDHDYAIRPLSKTYCFEPSDLGIRREDNVLGIEAPLWAEYVRDEKKFDFSLYPRLQALAENAWSKKSNKNYSDFKLRLSDSKKMMKQKNIGYANEKVADGKTLSWPRTLKAWLRWNSNPYAEFEINQTMEGD